MDLKEDATIFANSRRIYHTSSCTENVSVQLLHKQGKLIRVVRILSDAQRSSRSILFAARSEAIALVVVARDQNAGRPHFGSVQPYGGARPLIAAPLVQGYVQLSAMGTIAPMRGERGHHEICRAIIGGLEINE